MIRSWGEEASLHVTSKFEAPLLLANVTGPHPEIEALHNGGEVLENFIQNSLQNPGVTHENLEIRLDKTRDLMKSNYRELFSEVLIKQDGTLFIHDGYHRAGLAVHNGLDYFHAVVSIPLDLR